MSHSRVIERTTRTAPTARAVTSRSKSHLRLLRATDSVATEEAMERPATGLPTVVVLGSAESPAVRLISEALVEAGHPVLATVDVADIAAARVRDPRARIVVECDAAAGELNAWVGDLFELHDDLSPIFVLTGLVLGRGGVHGFRGFELDGIVHESFHSLDTARAWASGGPRPGHNDALCPTCGTYVPYVDGTYAAHSTTAGPRGKITCPRSGCHVSDGL